MSIDECINTGTTLQGVSGKTSRKDNTCEERLKALRMLEANSRDEVELAEWREMLAIRDEWLEEEEGPEVKIGGRAVARRPKGGGTAWL